MGHAVVDRRERTQKEHTSPTPTFVSRTVKVRHPRSYTQAHDGALQSAGTYPGTASPTGRPSSSRHPWQCPSLPTTTRCMATSASSNDDNSSSTCHRYVVCVRQSPGIHTATSWQNSCELCADVPGKICAAIIAPDKSRLCREAHVATGTSSSSSGMTTGGLRWLPSEKDGTEEGATPPPPDDACTAGRQKGGSSTSIAPSRARFRGDRWVLTAFLNKAEMRASSSAITHGGWTAPQCSSDGDRKMCEARTSRTFILEVVVEKHTHGMQLLVHWEGKQPLLLVPDLCNDREVGRQLVK